MEASACHDIAGVDAIAAHDLGEPRGEDRVALLELCVSRHCVARAVGDRDLDDRAFGEVNRALEDQLATENLGTSTQHDDTLPDAASRRKRSKRSDIRRLDPIPAPAPSRVQPPPMPPRPARWSCPTCGRTFARANQGHTCGTGDGSDVTRGRPDSIVRTYAALEATVRALGEIEIVARDRSVLFRTVRIFADLSVMTDAVRIAIHLARTVEDPRFIKVVADRNKVTHVAKLRSADDVAAVAAYLREAYAVSLR